MKRRRYNQTELFLCLECRSGLDLHDFDEGYCPSCGASLADQVQDGPRIVTISEFKKRYKPRPKPSDDDPGPEAA